MSALAVVLLETLCCLGLGAAVLRVLRIDGDLQAGEHWALSFAIGFGVLGWLVFPVGVSGFLSEGPLTVLLSAGALAAVLLRRTGAFLKPPRIDAVGRVLLVLLGLVFVFDLLEGLAPPADADTLAYHFAVPKQFLDAGRIDFILQPLNGAVPFGVNMTYIPAMALGGEMAVTLWTMVSGWAAAALLFVLSRPHLGFNWSLATALIFLTTPAVIYGGGSGHVETRIALFVMVAAWATVRAIQTGQTNYAVLAGLGAGFFAAAKYTGLLFAAVSGLVVVIQRRWLKNGALFGAAMLVAGFQWYAWNALHTGDPVFPMLFQWLGRDDLALWPKAHDLFFKESYFGSENPLPKTLPWLFLFPFKATLFPQVLPDAGRVGLGPFGLLVLPFAVLGVWRFRDKVRRSPLLVYAALAFLFYVTWFFVGGSQRLRHLVPILPLFLICMTVAAQRLTDKGSHRGPLLAAVVATIFIQFAGHGVFALNYFKFLAGGADHQAFLIRNVNSYVAVPWINTNLTKSDRIFIQHRQLKFYLSVPSLFGSPMQAVVELRPEKTDARTVYAQLRSGGITHFLLARKETGNDTPYVSVLNYLFRAGCLDLIKRFKGHKVRSRTLPALVSNPQTLDVLRLKDETCIK